MRLVGALCTVGAIVLLAAIALWVLQVVAHALGTVQ